MSFRQILHFVARYSIDIKQWVFFVGCIMVTVANITSFHLIPTAYNDIISGKEAPFFQLVRRAQGLEYFETLQDETKSIVFSRQDSIFASLRAREALTDRLEFALERQPQSTELLRALVTLYQQQGDGQKVTVYLSRLRALDPVAK